MQHKATIFYEWEQGKSAYNFPFPYLSKQFVKVRVDHANASTLLEYNRDYTIEGQTLTLTPVQPFVAGATLCIYRQTPTGSLVDFSDGSLLLASEMDRLSTQLLHVEEENSDLIASTGMFADDDNAWQGQGRRIKNLSDPQQPQDVVTLNYLDGVGVARQDELQRIETAVRADKESTLSFKNEAASSAQGAAASASASAQSAAASEGSRQASAVSESNIKNMQVDVHAIQQHVDEVKTALDGVAARAKADGQTASDAAVQAQHSAGASAQSAAASEASAVRAEAATKYEGIVKSENLAEKSVHKKHLHQDAYESPAFTGTPTTPTAVRGTNNTQIANTAFVAQAISALVNSAPGTLDTLQELAAALGNDANFAATVTNALAGKLGKTEIAARAYELVGWTIEHNRSYAVGDIAYHKDLPSWARLECVVAGTTGSNANIFPTNAKAGQYIQDGSVRWIVDDVRDCNRVGTVTGSLYIPDGYIKANGATVQRADYPRLVALADRYKLWTSDSTGRDLGLFGRADGSTTMVLPNWIDRMLQFSDCNNGTEYGWTVKAGLPNIKGHIGNHSKNHSLFDVKDIPTEGALHVKDMPSKQGVSGSTAVDNWADSIDFDASRSNPIYGRSTTVQPAAIQLFPIIKY